MTDLQGGARDYSVFGLKIRSSIALPELFPANEPGEPDVVVRCGPVSEAEGAPFGMSAVNGALILVIESVGRYKIEKGRAITVEPAHGVPERNLRLFLLGSAFGALLHQRGLLPLHANAVEIDGMAVAFMGESGAGKSTLAAWFHDRGHRIIADDLCVVAFDARGGPYAAPGLPRLRLWAEALQIMDRSPAGLQRSYVGDAEDKFDLPIEEKAATRSETSLAAVYVLERGHKFSVEPLRGVGAAETIFANTYRGSYLSLAKEQALHWKAAVQLVSSVPVFRATRRWALDRLEKQCEQLREHARSQVQFGTERCTEYRVGF